MKIMDNMNDIPCVSVIVPIFNSDKYLNRCLQSIVNQTIINIEIICIDDGSTDQSSIILKEWAERDSRIMSLKNENYGQSRARNAGINLARGKYIAFIDSDDYINPNMLEEMYNNAEKYNSDCVVCGFNLIYEDKKKINRKAIRWGKSKEFSVETISCKTIAKLRTNVLDKIYKRSVVVDNLIRFNEDIMFNEDGIFVWEFVTNIKNIVFLDKDLYNYVQREGSIMDTIYSSNGRLILQLIDSWYEIDKIIRKKRENSIFIRSFMESVSYSVKHFGRFICPELQDEWNFRVMNFINDMKNEHGNLFLNISNDYEVSKKVSELKRFSIGSIFRYIFKHK